jgi:hypothetical protein
VVWGRDFPPLYDRGWSEEMHLELAGGGGGARRRGEWRGPQVCNVADCTLGGVKDPVLGHRGGSWWSRGVTDLPSMVCMAHGQRF